MPEDEEQPRNPQDLPTEMLLQIFTYLPARQLVRSRQVCVRWKNIIDRLVSSDNMWREHCQKDFAKLYRIARRQSRPGLLWFQIYRSLALWPQLKYARELRDEFSSASAIYEEVRNVVVLDGGILGVHTRSSINYYDIETLEPSKRRSIRGAYTDYAENEDTIVTQNEFLHLYILKKNRHDDNYTIRTTVHDVGIYLLVNREVYYVTTDNTIYVINLDDSYLSTHLVQSCSEPVMAMGYTDRLNLITYKARIYSVENGALVLKSDLEGCTDLVHQVKQYNLLETVRWRIMYQWHCIWGQRVPDVPMQSIIRVKTYGDMVFVGCNWGVLRIYHKPYIAGVFDFYHSEPVKQYNFNDLPVLSYNCQILQIEVVEAEDGHTILVCMPKKIVVINYVHDFKRSASVALLPYSDGQKNKVMKI